VFSTTADLAKGRSRGRASVPAGSFRQARSFQPDEEGAGVARSIWL